MGNEGILFRIIQNYAGMWGSAVQYFPSMHRGPKFYLRCHETNMPNYPFLKEILTCKSKANTSPMSCKKKQKTLDVRGETEQPEAQDIFH